MKEGSKVLFRFLIVAGGAVLAAVALALLHAAALAAETPASGGAEAAALVETAAPARDGAAPPIPEGPADAPEPESVPGEAAIPAEAASAAGTAEEPATPEALTETASPDEPELGAAVAVGESEVPEELGPEDPAEARESPPPVAEGAPAVPKGTKTGLVHTVVKGDTLWDLSARYLGSPWKWPELWERNRFLTNPHYIYPGIRIVVFPPGAKDYLFSRLGREDVIVTAPSVTGEGRRILGLAPQEIVRAGEFVRKRPAGIGAIRDGRQPRVAFSEGDEVYLRLDRKFPAGQMLGVYRIRGPVKGPGVWGVSGYVKYLVGVIQVTGTERRATTGVIRASYEDLLRTDVVSEELPGYTPIVVDPGGERLESAVVTARHENTEMAAGDFVFIDRGEKAGVSVGNVFRIITGREGMFLGSPGEQDDLRIEVGKAVVVKTNPDFATAYVIGSQQSFSAGSAAVRGTRPSP